MELPESAFAEIILELERQPLEINRFRLNSGLGRSQTFGIVNKRCEIPDLARQCWLRPYLYHLLLDFAKKYIKISWTGIQVNQDYHSKPHRDAGNNGNSIIVGFGDYTGGELNCWGVPHDIRHKPLIFDGSKELHWTLPWVGTRYSLVFHTLNPRFPLVRYLEEYEPVIINNKWKIKYTSDHGDIEYLDRKNGLPHLLSGRKVSKKDS